MKTVLVTALSLAFVTNALADAQLTSWLTDYSGQYARVYTTTNNRNNDVSATTWSGQTSPVYADIEEVMYSSSWVYVRAADLPSYRIGPWLNPQGAVGTLWPSNQGLTNRFPRTHTTPTTKTSTGTGYSGLFVNGVAVFNFTDGKAWDGGSIVSGPHIQPTYYWHRNAPVGEDYNFDYTLGHQNPAGVFHSHQQPIALRYQLGDHVDFSSTTKKYSESTNTVSQHSPILGWAYDGYPIYGPYGYSISNNASSGVRRMVSGFVQRDGNNGTDQVATNLWVIPAWYARYRLSHFGGTYSTTAGTNRAPVNSTYPLGTFAEDFSYLGDLTNAATGKLYVPGTNTFDLDVYNGRWCVTPEYPSGTYAYFVDIDSNSVPTYPYTLGFEYYGGASGGAIGSITEAVTTNFYGGADSTLALNTPTITNNVVTLVWSSTEGGTYQVESSTNQTTWTVEKTGVPAAVGVSTTTNYTSSVTSGTGYVRVSRTALATYDPVGGESGVVAQTNVQSFLLGNSAPTVANPIPNQTNTYGTSFTYTFPANTFTDADSGQTLTYTASSTALTNTGISFNAATRTFSATTIDATNGGTIAGSYTVQVIATDNGSPALSATNSFSLVINKTAVSVTGNSYTRCYGATNPVFTGTLSGFVGADSITANFSTTADTNSAPNYWPITPTLNDPGARLGNYLVTTNNGTLTITQAVLTVTANSASRTYGATNPPFTVTYSGFTNGQTLANSGVGGSPILTTSATTNSSVGTYTITNSAGTLSADNYSFKFVNGTLTVNKASLFAAADSFIVTYGSAMPTFTGTITGATNGDVFTESFTCSATTNSTPAPYSIVTAINDPGNKLGNYTVTTNNGQLLIVPATLLVTPNNASRAYGATNPTFTSTFTGFVNGQTLATSDVTGTPGYLTTAATNSPVGIYGVTNYQGTLTSANYMFSFTNATLTVTQALMTVMPANTSRAYGQTNPVLTGTISGLANNDNITANYSTTAGTTSPMGSYAITATLNDPSSKLSNYSVTTNLGTLAVTSANGSNNYSVSFTSSNSVVSLITNGTVNYTFTDTNSGLAVVVAVTATPYSSSNATPVFTKLDFFGVNGTPMRAGINSGTSSGDGNWIDTFEGVNLAASLASASSGIATNTIKFGVADIGIRSNGGSITWTSSTRTNSFLPSSEALYALDTNTVALTNGYSGKLRNGVYQLTDNTGFSTALGIVFNVSFNVGSTQGSAATLGTPALSGNQLQFTISGTSGASYIVQAVTNITDTNWIPVSTNTAPFTFTDTNTAAYSQRFYRVVAQ